jgi:hypothetical protein
VYGKVIYCTATARLGLLITEEVRQGQEARMIETSKLACPVRRCQCVESVN